MDDIDKLFENDEDNESVEDDGDNDENVSSSDGNSKNSNNNNNSNLPDDAKDGKSKSSSNSDNLLPDDPDNVVRDHARSTPKFGNLGFSDSTKRNRRRSSNFQSRPTVTRHLSMVEEVDTDAESSILWTPIPPLVIQI